MSMRHRLLLVLDYLEERCQCQDGFTDSDTWRTSYLCDTPESIHPLIASYSSSKYYEYSLNTFDSCIVHIYMNMAFLGRIHLLLYQGIITLVQCPLVVSVLYIFVLINCVGKQF
jgi:hypothetical protein